MEFNSKIFYFLKIFSVTTTGGSGESTPCVFPFKYNGNLYYECITIDKNTPWCATTGDYDRDGKWGNCVGVKCFKIDDTLKTYNEAKALCIADKASLASITNSNEQGLKFQSKKLLYYYYYYYHFCMISAFITASLRYKLFNNFYIGGINNI